MTGHGVEVAWVAFAVVNLVAMFRYPAWVTIPFHLIWVSFAVLYGLREWRIGWTLVALGIIAGATGALITVEGLRQQIFPERAVEVPLMTAMFAAAAWHLRRHERVRAELVRVSDENRELLDRERRFVQAASHQLRTPITVALGHAELIARSDAPAQVREDAAVLVDELTRLRRLTSELLRLEVVLWRPLRPQATLVEPLLRAVAHRWSFADRRLRVTAPPALSVDLDVDRVEPAIDAVIDNAVKHTSAGDEIVISAGPEHGGCWLTVTDTGSGISPEDLEQVFDRFHRGDPRPAGAASRDGFGLGLALVREVVHAHGGEVSATSRGAGTTIRMRFPRRPGWRGDSPAGCDGAGPAVLDPALAPEASPPQPRGVVRG